MLDCQPVNAGPVALARPNDTGALNGRPQTLWRSATHLAAHRSRHGGGGAVQALWEYCTLQLCVPSLPNGGVLTVMNAIMLGGTQSNGILGVSSYGLMSHLMVERSFFRCPHTPTPPLHILTALNVLNVRFVSPFHSPPSSLALCRSSPPFPPLLCAQATVSCGCSMLTSPLPLSSLHTKTGGRVVARGRGNSRGTILAGKGESRLSITSTATSSPRRSSVPSSPGAGADASQPSPAHSSLRPPAAAAGAAGRAGRGASAS